MDYSRNDLRRERYGNGGNGRVTRIRPERGMTVTRSFCRTEVEKREKGLTFDTMYLQAEGG